MSHLERESLQYYGRHYGSQRGLSQVQRVSQARRSTPCGDLRVHDHDDAHSCGQGDYTN